MLLEHKTQIKKKLGMRANALTTRTVETSLAVFSRYCLTVLILWGKIRVFAEIRR